MKVLLEKKMMAPGDEDASCAAWHSGPNVEWIGNLLPNSKMKLQKLMPTWEFFFPHQEERSHIEDLTQYCLEKSYVFEKPYYVFTDETFYETKMEFSK